VAQRNSVLTVPNAALRFTPPDGAKFEAQGNAAPKLTRAQRIIYQPGANPDTLKATVVRIGITDGVNSEVLEGLKAGDRVITASTAPTAKKSGGFGGPPPS
jgi:HlyD family secretion protein